MSRRKTGSRWEDIDGGSAFIIPLSLLRHPNFRRLSPFGHKLLMDLACQYTGFNNGYLCASWSLMKSCGWRSNVTLRTAVAECEHYGLLIRTQQGGRNRPTLHAFSWRRIDAKAGRSLELAPTGKPPDEWKEERPLFAKPDHAPSAPRSRRARARKVAEN